VPQHGRPLKQRRGCLPCLYLVAKASQVGSIRLGVGLLFLPIDRSLSARVDRRHTDTTLQLFLVGDFTRSSQQLRFVLLSVFFFLSLGSGRGDGRWSKLDHIIDMGHTGCTLYYTALL
jgi:hypothetical protein